MPEDAFTEREAARLLEQARVFREAEVRALEERWDAHAREHVLHDKEHTQQQTALDTALRAVRESGEAHRIAHDREHAAHIQRHEDQAEAVRKAEAAVDRRLEGMNEFRAQLNAQAATFSTKDQLEALIKTLDQRFDTGNKHTDERYEENRRRIEALEKGDVKQEGRSLGQGAVVAIIVTAIGVTGTVLAIIIALANFATGTP